MVTGAGDSATGRAFLDRRIPEIVASMPIDWRSDLMRRLSFWYLYFGFLDRYFEIIFDQNPTDSGWTDADDLVSSGTILRSVGFTAHPKYLEVATLLGMNDLWEQRGPPDFCKNVDDRWICE